MLLVALLHVLSSCSGSSDSDAAPLDRCWRTVEESSGTAWLGLGLDFVPITEGDEVQIERGLQGGYHLVLNASMSGLDPGSGVDDVYLRPFTRFEVTIGADVLLSSFDCAFLAEYVPYSGDGGGDYVMDAGRIVFLDVPLVETLSDFEPGVLSAEIVDRYGVYTSLEHNIVLRTPPPPEATAQPAASDP